MTTRDPRTATAAQALSDFERTVIAIEVLDRVMVPSIARVVSDDVRRIVCIERDRLVQSLNPLRDKILRPRP